MVNISSIMGRIAWYISQLCYLEYIDHGQTQQRLYVAYHDLNRHRPAGQELP